MKHASKHDFLSLNIYPVSMTIFWVVTVLRHIFFDVAYVTIFKTDVMMMKYILRVEPSLMFDINRTRGHDVKEVVLPIGWRR